VNLCCNNLTLQLIEMLPQRLIFRACQPHSFLLCLRITTLQSWSLSIQNRRSKYFVVTLLKVDVL
jgi:hypothetical protein